MLLELKFACAMLKMVELNWELDGAQLDQDFNMRIVESFSECKELEQLCVADECSQEFLTAFDTVQDACNAWSLKSKIRFVRLFDSQYMPCLKRVLIEWSCEPANSSQK